MTLKHELNLLSPYLILASFSRQPLVTPPTSVKPCFLLKTQMIFYKLYFLYNVGLIRSFSMTINPVCDFFLFVFTDLRFSCLSCLSTKIYHHVSACSIQNCINNFPLKSDKIMLQKYKVYVLTFNDFYPLKSFL